MLFNDPVFLFLFLPVTLLLFFGLGRCGRRSLALSGLVGASLFFYAYWEPFYTLLLLGTIVVNGIFGWALDRDAAERRRKWVLGLGIAANLGLIGYFKYLGFFTELMNGATGQQYPVLRLALPLGISFFTFEQITYLVEAYRRTTRAYGPLEFVLFVTFFPRLIAGPIVRPGEIIPQFRELRLRPHHQDLIVGLTIFLVGLFEKVLVADTIAGTVNTLFSRGSHDLTFGEAWLAALGYTAQLYYDFSGYSNMALGLSRMFGIRLPLNFNSPYRATSIIDFWRRWHMSLSRFLRDYLYIPLGGSRHGEPRRYFNLSLTMVIGGLWHGAGLTFLLWGALHGAALVVNHLWRSRLRAARPARGWAAPASFALTFLCVVVGWVLFRAPDLPSAAALLKSLVGGNGISVSGWIAALLPFLPLQSRGFGDLFHVPSALFVLVSLVWAVRGPNLQEWMASVEPGLESVGVPSKWNWRPSLTLSILMGVGLFLVLNTLFRAAASEFLYFNF